jgi:hypothetical protein
MTDTENTIRHCPKCGSVRVCRSRRRGPFEALIVRLGAQICRCHDCCLRRAWFGITPVPIGNRDPEGSPWTAILLVGSGGAALALVLWAITRFTERSS